MTIKMTVVTNASGAIVAAQYGHTPYPDTSTIVALTEFRGGLLAGPGQTLRVLDAPDTLAHAISHTELETQLKALIK